jgi:DNA polymerase III delta subunit
MAKKLAPLPPFIVAFGAESFFHDRDIARYRRWPGHQAIVVDGDGLTDVALVEICESGSMDDVSRIVIVDEANKVKGDKALKQYIENKAPQNNTTVLVAVIRSEKCPALWAQAAKKGKLQEHRKLKTFEPHNEVVAWIREEAEKRAKITLDTGVAEALFALVGNNLHQLASEMRKLQVLVGSAKVTINDLKRTVSASPSSDPYQVADAALNKDRRLAMNRLTLVYRNMGDDANVPVAYALMKQVEKFLVARSLLDRGVSEEDVATALGMSPARFSNHVVQHVRKHRLADLVKAMGRLCLLDENVKRTTRSKRTHVELAVLSVAG